MPAISRKHSTPFSSRYGMPLSFFSPDGRISVAAAHSPLRSMKSNMPSNRPRSLMNASKARPSTMSCSTRSDLSAKGGSCHRRPLLSQAWARNPSSLLFVTHRRPKVKRNRQRTTKMFLSGLGLLQLLPPLLQGCGDPPPLFQVLLESAISCAVLPHHSQLFLLDIGQHRTTVLGAG